MTREGQPDAPDVHGLSRCTRWTSRAYRRLARALPEDFWREYRDEVLADLHASLTDAEARGGARAAFRAGASSLWDLTLRIPQERAAARKRRSRLEKERSGYRPKPIRGPSHGGGEVMGTLRQELRLAIRSLARRPGFTTVAVVTVGLGIGATVAIFSLVNAILIRPLPFPDSERIVTIRHHAPGIDLDDLNNSPGTIRLYRDHAEAFSDLGAYTRTQRNLTGGDEPARIRLLQATPGLFGVLRVQPRLGRPFTPQDAEAQAPPVAILTHSGWSARFGSDPGVIGKTVELDGVATEIVGVMPPLFSFPDPETAALVPLHVDPQGEFGEFGIDLLARLTSGVSLERAWQHVADLQARIPELVDEEITAEFMEGIGWSSSVEPLRDVMIRNVRALLWIVLGTVGFVLVIACANVANLFLVRAEARRKETAIREAMGASRGRLALSFLGESMVLGVAGGLLGILVATVAVDLLVTREVVDLPRLHEVRLDATVVTFALALSILAGLAFGLIPLARSFSWSVAGGLAAAGRRATEGRESQRLRSFLVAGQLALALVLLVGSGLMLRSYARLRSVEPGFSGEGVLLVGLSYGDREDPWGASRFYQQVMDEVAALPGVEEVGVTSGFPFSEGSVNGGSFYIESQPREDDDIPPVTMFKPISHGYFEALRMRLVAGRSVQASDVVDGRALAWVNETFVRRFLEGDAIGERIRFDDGEESDWAEIAGVVGDVREFGLDEAVRPMVYLPLIVGNWGALHLDRMFLTIRTEREVPGLVPAVRRVVQGIDPTVPVLSARTLDEALARSMAEVSHTALLLALAAFLALLLGSVGLFGVISYIVGQRTREIGVRVALGARGEDVVRLFLRQAIRVSMAGVVVGLGVAFALTRVMAAILFEVSATDPLTFVAAPVVLLSVALLATWAPTRRASRIDPVEALRAE